MPVVLCSRAGKKISAKEEPTFIHAHVGKKISLVVFWFKPMPIEPVFYTSIDFYFRSVDLPTSIMVATCKLSKISQKFQKMRASKCNNYDHVVITMYTTHSHTHTQSCMTIPSEDFYCFFFCCLTQDNPIDFVHE